MGAISTKKAFMKQCRDCKVIFKATGRYCKLCDDCKRMPGENNRLQGRPPGSSKEWGFPKH